MGLFQEAHEQTLGYGNVIFSKSCSAHIFNNTTGEFPQFSSSSI